MEDTAGKTRATYDEVARQFLENTRDRARGARDLDAFAAALPAGATVLDLGSGPGCDSAELRARGLRAVSMDLSLGMLRAGVDEFPGPRVQGDLTRLPFRAGSAAGVWANACLLHLAPRELRGALAEIARVCSSAARVHVSVKIGAGAAWESARYGRPRWFQYWTPKAFDAVLGAAGFEILEAREEETRRDRWIVRAIAPGPGAPTPRHDGDTLAAMAPTSELTGLTTRAPSETDWPAVLALANASVAALPHVGPQEEWLGKRRGFDAATGAQHHLVAVRDGVVEGYGSTESGAGSGPSSYRMYLVTRPEHYASVGQVLYEALSAGLQERGATEAWLIEHVGDRAVVPFVLERGFREARRMRLPEGTEALVLTKSLGSGSTS